MLRALESLAEVASRTSTAKNVDTNSVLFTGHSNGGYGAWFFATHYPDWTLGVAPLAGMSTIGTTEGRRRPPAGTDAKVWAVLDKTLDEYRGDNLVRNLVGKPFLARTGDLDRVIAPSQTLRMADLLRGAGVALTRVNGGSFVSKAEDVSVVVVPGKEHWWWDTKKTNDGGALDDAELRKFYKRAHKKRKKTASKDRISEEGRLWDFICHNPVSCGSRGGVRILQQVVIGTVSVVSKTGRNSLITTNVARISLSSDEGIASDGISIDGTVFSQQHECNLKGQTDECQANQHREFCLGQSGGVPQWSQCADSLSPTTRSALSGAGPLRRVLSSKLLLCHTGRAVHYKAALDFAKDWYAVGGGTARLDTTASCTPQGGEHVIHFGMSAPHGYHIGPCDFSGRRDIGIVSLQPGLSAYIAGQSDDAFVAAVDAFRSDLFVTNSWQHRLPDWVVIGKGGVYLAAGHWSNTWELEEETSVLKC